MQSCLARTNGNQKEADYLMEKSYWQYYYDLVQYNEYIKRYKEVNKIK